MLEDQNLNTNIYCGKYFWKAQQTCVCYIFLLSVPTTFFCVFFVFSRPILPTFQVLPILPISRSVK